jgi:hypothetical protein
MRQKLGEAMPQNNFARGIMERATTRVIYSESETNAKLDVEIAALDALIDAQMRAMKEKLAGGHTLFELGEDAEKLTLLVRSRKNKIESLVRQSRSASASR